MTDFPWELKELEKRRLNIILEVLEGREIIVIIDETGDPKKGKTTDYVKRQYIGNLGKIETRLLMWGNRTPSKLITKSSWGILLPVIARISPSMYSWQISCFASQARYSSGVNGVGRRSGEAIMVNLPPIWRSPLG